jgi:hypothetical protein
LEAVDARAAKAVSHEHILAVEAVAGVQLSVMTVDVGIRKEEGASRVDGEEGQATMSLAVPIEAVVVTFRGDK